MSTENGKYELDDVELFRDLTKVEFDELLVGAQVRSYRAGETIYAVGQVERALYVLLDGTVEVDLTVPKLGEKVVAIIGAHSVFGENSFFHAAPHAATVKCTTNSHVLRLDRATFDELVRKNSIAAFKVGMNAAAMLAARLQNMDRWVVEQLSRLQDQVVIGAWRQLRTRLTSFAIQPHGFTAASIR